MLFAYEREYSDKGAFMNVVIRSSPDSATAWHKRFAELYEGLYETGYLAEYMKKPIDAVRYLPVGEFIRNEPMALPSDRLEVILERLRPLRGRVPQRQP